MACEDDELLFFFHLSYRLAQKAVRSLGLTALNICASMELYRKHLVLQESMTLANIDNRRDLELFFP